MRRDARLTFVIRWMARLWAAGLLLFWGAFFLEHTSEWFIRPPREWPAVEVLGLHLVHLIFLTGLLVGWRWELAGGILVLIAATVFFPIVGGTNGGWFWAFSSLPGILWIFLTLCRQRPLTMSYGGA